MQEAEPSSEQVKSVTDILRPHSTQLPTFAILRLFSLTANAMALLLPEKPLRELEGLKGLKGRVRAGRAPRKAPGAEAEAPLLGGCCGFGGVTVLPALGAAGAWPAWRLRLLLGSPKTRKTRPPPLSQAMFTWNRGTSLGQVRRQRVAGHACRRLPMVGGGFLRFHRSFEPKRWRSLPLRRLRTSLDLGALRRSSDLPAACQMS